MKEPNWIPLDFGHERPPEGQVVEVLYRDGVVERATLYGVLPILESTGQHRYAEAKFWRPIPVATTEPR